MAIAERPVRRLVTVDGPDGRSRTLSDAPLHDVLRDPARPGFSITRVWATDRTPATALAAAAVQRLAAAIGAPRSGSAFRIVVLPPDSEWLARCTRADVDAFFRAAGAPEAGCWADDAPHPYMQRTPTLDLCVVLEGEPTLVLDTARVTLAATDTVVQRGTRHAWSNLTARPCVIAVSSHDAAQDPTPGGRS